MKKETRQNENGIYETIETIETMPNDGVVPEKVIRPIDIDTLGKYHKEYTKTKIYSTNDPRITRPFIYGMCGLFFGIGLFTLLIGLWYFAIPFISISIFAFIKSKKDIDKIAEELKAKGHDVTIDSALEKEKIKEEFVEAIKDNVKDVTSSVFTKDKFKWFVKTTIPIYCVITVIITLLFSLFINMFLGIFIFIILAIGGLLYYFILSKICKY